MFNDVEKKVRYTYLEQTKCTVAYLDEYEDKNAPVIVFIHGLGNSFIVWQQNIQYLKRDFRCIAVDLPGNGLSEKRGDVDYSIPYYAGTIAEFVRTVVGAQVHLAGHSMGGQVALYCAIHYTDIVGSLLLAAPAGFERFSPVEVSMMTASAKFFDHMMSHYDKLSQALQVSFYHQSQVNEIIKDQLLELLRLQDPLHYKKMIDQSIASMLKDTVIDDLDKISVPALLIFGEQDAMIPNKIFHPVTTVRFAREAAARIPGAVLELVPHTGHFVQVEAMSVVNDKIHRFAKTAV